MRLPILALCASAPLAGCAQDRPAAPPPACMHRPEVGAVAGVTTVSHRYYDENSGFFKKSNRTYVKFTMPDGTVRVCQSSDGATALSTGDRVSATTMILSDLGADESTDTLGKI